MTLPSKAKLALIILYTPLLLSDLGMWLFEIIYHKEQWECLVFRADHEISIKPQFLFFTEWASMLTLVLFLPWAVSRPGTKLHKFAQSIFRVALPHACTVMVCFFYYYYGHLVPLNNGYTDYESCHGAMLSKDITPNHTFMVDVYIFFAYLASFVGHLFIAPLLLLLLFSGEFEYDSVVPYSTIFAILLGVAVGLADMSGSPIYSGNNWVWAGGVVVFNFFFHVLFVLWHKRMPSFLCRCRATVVEPDETEQDEEHGLDRPREEAATETNAEKEKDASEESTVCSEFDA